MQDAEHSCLLLMPASAQWVLLPWFLLWQGWWHTLLSFPLMLLGQPSADLVCSFVSTLLRPLPVLEHFVPSTNVLRSALPPPIATHKLFMASSSLYQPCLTAVCYKLL